MRSYRSRLVIYSIVLMLFLSGTLVYSYQYMRDVLLQEAEHSFTRLARLLDMQLEMERGELRRYAQLVSDDLRMQEYMFVVVQIGSDSEALYRLYERLFGWLPVDRWLILAEDGRILAGARRLDLAEQVLAHAREGSGLVFHFRGREGLEMVAVAPVVYRDMRLGFIIVTQVLDGEWMRRHRKRSGGHLFIEQNGVLLAGTHEQMIGKPFAPTEGRIVFGDEIFRVYPITLAAAGEDVPRLWFGISVNDLVERLEQHRRFILLLVAAGMLGVLAVGLGIVRNFSRPLSQLMHLTREVAAGRLPRMDKSQAQNEIAELSNHFADMLQALREQQREIERVHAQLEKSAITDMLTGLYNRRHLQELFPKLWAQVQRDGRCLGAILADLDHFKKINDRYGHLAGDSCLIHFADQLRRISRTSDFLFRIGGEEFLVLTVSEDVSGPVALAEKIRAATENRPVSYKDCSISLTVSCGVSCADNQGPAETVLTRLLTRADTALYQAKRAGRNRVHAAGSADK